MPFSNLLSPPPPHGEVLHRSSQQEALGMTGDALHDMQMHAHILSHVQLLGCSVPTSMTAIPLCQGLASLSLCCE